MWYRYFSSLSFSLASHEASFTVDSTVCKVFSTSSIVAFSMLDALRLASSEISMWEDTATMPSTITKRIVTINSTLRLNLVENDFDFELSIATVI